MFDLYGNERLIKWKQFRDSVETSNSPLEDVANFWSHAPFVSPYLPPSNPTSWPDPWQLIADGRFDELAIVIGMLYTIKLTQRFMDSKCEIHTTILSKEKEPIYMLIIDDQQVINFEYRTVSSIKVLENIETSLIWSK